MVSFVAMVQNLISPSPATISRLESLRGRGIRADGLVLFTAFVS